MWTAIANDMNRLHPQDANVEPPLPPPVGPPPAPLPPPRYGAAMAAGPAVVDDGLAHWERVEGGTTYPVVIINWVQHLGPPGPFSFPDSRDLLDVLGDFLGRERGGGP